MAEKLCTLLDRISNFLASRKGLLPLVGILLILANIVFQFFPGLGWIMQANLFLHLGLVVAILGFMLAWAL